jgi:hypothetical protein
VNQTKTSLPPRFKWSRYAVCASLWISAVWCWNTASHHPQLTTPAFAKAPDSFKLIDPDEAKSSETKTSEPQLAGAAIPPAARKYDTFAHWVLDLESQATPVSHAKYAVLDSIIDAVKQGIDYDPSITDPAAERRQAVRILREIDRALIEHNVVYPPGEYDTTELRLGLSPQTFDRDTIRQLQRTHLNARRFKNTRPDPARPFYVLDCDTCSFVYIGIADACGFGDRLHLVDLPDHMFVRWEFSDGSHLNWDTNDASVVEDKEYAKDYDLTKRLRRGRVYLASMTRQEAKGHVYYLRAGTYENRGDIANSIADMEKVVELIPQSTQAKSDLAWLYATAEGVSPEKRQQALKLAQAALDLEPRCGDFWDTLAVAHAANGDFKKALSASDKAVLYALTWEARAEYRARRRDFEKRRIPNIDQ